MLMNVGRLVYCVFEDRQHTYMLTIIGIVVNAKFSGCLLMVSLGTTSYVVCICPQIQQTGHNFGHCRGFICTCGSDNH